MTTDPPFLLEDMPQEILLHILKQGLDINDLKTVRSLGRLWCRVASDNKLWQNIVEQINDIPNYQSFNFYDVQDYIEMLLMDAKFHDVSCLADSFLRNWFFQNFNNNNNEDITVEKVRKLFFEIEKQKKWEEVNLKRFGHIHQSNCIRSSTPDPSIKC